MKKICLQFFEVHRVLYSYHFAQPPDCNRILTPKHQLSGLEGRAKPGLVAHAQLVDVTQTTTKNTLEKTQKTQQSTKVWLK